MGVAGVGSCVSIYSYTADIQYIYNDIHLPTTAHIITYHILYLQQIYIYIYTVESQPSTSYTTQYINHTSYTVISQQQI